MSLLLRSLAFARRFAPFWMIWALILALPAAREPLSLQLLGSSVAPIYQTRWLQNFSSTPEFDGFALAKKKPRDLNARLWRFSLMLNGQAAGFGEDGEPNRKPYSLRELLREVSAIQADFPDQKWLNCLPILNFEPSRDAKTKRWEALQGPRVLLSLIAKSARDEPRNAYYPLLEAELYLRQNRMGAMWRALNRAAKCQVFETHELEWRRAIVAAHQEVRPLLLEEREALWRKNSRANWRDVADWPVILSNDTFSARQNGDHRRAIAVGALLAGIGDLMQRGTNSRPVAIRGGQWKSAAWQLLNKNARATSNAAFNAASNARIKKLHVYQSGDVALLVPKWAARQRQLGFLGSGNDFYSGRPTPPERRDAFWRAGFWRDAGAFVGVHLLFVSASWLLVNLILWRGVGAPSGTKERTIPALLLVLASAALGWWSWSQIDIIATSMNTRWTPGIENFAFAIASVVLLAFFGAPFLLAIVGAGTTLWKHKSQFLKPARIETELRLSPRDATILKSGATILCAASLVATLGIWLLWIGLVAGGVTTLDPFGWLSASKIGALPVAVLIAPLLYCLFLDFLCFLLWFNKWRYYCGKASRPLAHGGLRSWKESLGIYIIVGSAIYLGVALVGWPARAEAARELETRMARGELPP